VTFGFTSASANGEVDRLVDAIYTDLGLSRGHVSKRRVAAFVTARHLLDEGASGHRPNPEETIALASWLSTGRVGIVADDDDDEEEDEYEEEASEADVQMRDWWPPIRLLRALLG
jgi:hypothetical protein